MSKSQADAIRAKLRAIVAKYRAEWLAKKAAQCKPNCASAAPQTQARAVTCLGGGSIGCKLLHPILGRAGLRGDAVSDLRASALSAIDCPGGELHPIDTLRAHFQLSPQFAAAVIRELHRQELEQFGDWQALLDLLPAVAYRATEHVARAECDAGWSLMPHIDLTIIRPAAVRCQPESVRWTSCTTRLKTLTLFAPSW